MVLNSMALAMRGLKPRPTYEGLTGAASSDGLQNVKFPNRGAKFLREGFVVSQLDGEGMRVMEQQRQQAMNDSPEENLLEQAPVATGANRSD